MVIDSLIKTTQKRMAVNHYENFPVASVLLPASIRTDVVNLYRFARSADDIADEGDSLPSERLRSLTQYRQALHTIGENPHLKSVGDTKLDPIFVPLAATIIKHSLPLTPFSDLLSAFEQDITTKRYQTEQSLNDYCRRSANPVGRLMLILFQKNDALSHDQSDAICTALQRINFLQDIAIDFKKERIYLSKQSIEANGVTLAHFAQQRCDSAWRRLMQDQVQICRDLMQQGAPLGRRLRGRAAWEMRLIIQGGLRILEKIEAVDFDVFRHRPTLNKADWARLIWRSI